MLLLGVANFVIDELPGLVCHFVVRLQADGLAEAGNRLVIVAHRLIGAAQHHIVAGAGIGGDQRVVFGGGALKIFLGDIELPYAIVPIRDFWVQLKRPLEVGKRPLVILLLE